MKTSTMTLIAFFAAFLLLIGTQGCYTQLGSTRDEEVYNDDRDTEAVTENEQPEEDAEEARDEDARGYGEDWDSHVRFGFDYYYPYTYWPSVMFSVAYNDPWYHWYGYDPWYSSYYSPWYYNRPWTPYYSYYGYGYGYGYGYYYPGYYYQNVAPVPRTSRNFGSTRGTGGARGVNASEGMRGGINDPQNMDLPSGSGRVVTGGTSAGKPGSVKAGERSPTSGSSRKAAARRSRNDSSPSRSGVSSRDYRRIYRDRGSVSGSSKSGSEAAPSVTPPGYNPSGGSSRSGGGRTSGDTPSTRSSGSSGRSSPPPSATPAPRSSPPPQSSGTSRSGGTRNPKP